MIRCGSNGGSAAAVSRCAALHTAARLAGAGAAGRGLPRGSLPLPYGGDGGSIDPYSSLVSLLSGNLQSSAAATATATALIDAPVESAWPPTSETYKELLYAALNAALRAEVASSASAASSSSSSLSLEGTLPSGAFTTEAACLLSSLPPALAGSRRGTARASSATDEGRQAPKDGAS